MTRDQIIQMAGHRHVSEWVIKLVGDAVAFEREACAKLCDELDAQYWSDYGEHKTEYSKEIRARGNQ